MNDVGLICMLVIASLRCFLNKYLLIMGLVILISKKFRDLFIKTNTRNEFIIICR